MKNLFLTVITIALLSTLGCSSCKKEIILDNLLPPITQTGANTVGFILNGQPWTPKGQVGVSSNLAINVDFGFNKGVFGISAYRVNNLNSVDYFGLGIRDSLNFYNAPFSIQLNQKSLFVASFSGNTCSTDYYDTTIYREGNLTITKLDKINKIIAGNFSFTLFKASCGDTIKITDGRFDMKY